MELDDLAQSFDALGDEMVRTADHLDAAEVWPESMGGQGPGRLGELARALAQQHSAAINARSAEAAQVIDVAEDLHGSLMKVLGRYRDLEARRTGNQ